MIALPRVIYFHICKRVCVHRDIQSGCLFEDSSDTGTKQISPKVLSVAETCANIRRTKRLDIAIWIEEAIRRQD